MQMLSATVLLFLVMGMLLATVAVEMTVNGIRQIFLAAAP